MNRNQFEQNFCCEAFAKEAESQFEYDEDGWNINGCCGGGCYVVTGMRFCPFCGTNLIKKIDP